MKKPTVRIFRNWLSDISQTIRRSYLRFAGVRIESNTFVSYGAWIDVSRGSVRIGQNCTITKGCKIISHSAIERRLSTFRKGRAVETIIEDNVFIGMNSIILPNVRIGRNSIVGAGSVVVKDIPPDAIVVGNPARVIKRYNRETGCWDPVVTSELDQSSQLERKLE